jgi:hypothetical protein
MANYRNSTTYNTNNNNNNNNNNIVTLALSTTGIIQNKLYDSLKLLHILTALRVYIPKQKAVILHTCCIVRKVLAQ